MTVGYLSYGTRHADLLFEIINRRYENKPLLVITNKPFQEWPEAFPNASCVVSMIDRLVHHSHIIGIQVGSYRLKEAREKEQQRAEKRRRSKKSNPKKTSKSTDD